MNTKYHIIPRNSTRSRRDSYDHTFLPVESKFKHVWQSLRFKLKVRLIINGLVKAAAAGDRDEHIKSFVSCRTPKKDQNLEDYLPSMILHPDNIYLEYWNVLVGLTMIYTSIFMPYLLAFPPSGTVDPVDLIDKIFTGIYGIDFFINLSTAYFNKKSVLITDRKKIFKFYLRSWFLVDFLSFFPFDIILDTKKNVPVILKLAKLLKISKIINWVKVTNRHGLILKLQDLLSMRHLITQTFIRFSMILLCVHIATCLWCFAANDEGYSIDSWPFRSGLQDEDNGTLYISGFYWAVTTFSTVGYGDIDAGTNEERILSVFWMFFCTGLLGIVIGSLSNIFAKIDTFDTMMMSKLSAIDEFTTECKLPKTLRDKLRAAIQQSSTIAGYSIIENYEIFEELPRTLRFEVALAMHRGAARSLKFFQNKDDAIISGIVPLLIPSYITKDNFVYKISDYPDEIYFIVKGLVLYQSKERLAVYTTKKRDYFGDIEFFGKIPRVFSACCRKNTEILVLTNQTISRIKKDYPLIWLELKHVAKGRKKVMEMNAERVSELNSFSRVNSQGEVQIQSFKTFHRIRRDMQDTLKHDEIQIKRKITEFEISEVIDRINRKLGRMKENIELHKRYSQDL